MVVKMEEIKKLRDKTGAGVMDAKAALEEAQTNAKGKMSNNKLMTEAEEIIKKKGLAKADKKAERETEQGIIYAYVHHNDMSGALVKLVCETDFVAKTEDFQTLAKELAMQVVSMEPKDVKDFLEQEYVRDSSLTIEGLIKQTAGKLGENVQLKEFVRLTV